MSKGSKNSSRRISPGCTAHPAGPSFLILTIASPVFGHGTVLCCALDLVIVRNLYVVGIAIPPNEAHAELVINGNTVLAFPVMLQLFQSAAGRDPQVLP